VLKPTSNGTNGFGAHDTSIDDDEADDPNAQLEKESRRVRLSTGSTISEGQNQNQGQDVEMN